MDFMFEDEVDEVGSDVEAYCPKCKGDTTHVVHFEIRRRNSSVQCNPVATFTRSKPVATWKMTFPAIAAKSRDG